MQFFDVELSHNVKNVKNVFYSKKYVRMPTNFEAGIVYILFCLGSRFSYETTQFDSFIESNIYDTEHR